MQKKKKIVSSFPHLLYVSDTMSLQKLDLKFNRTLYSCEQVINTIRCHVR